MIKYFCDCCGNEIAARDSKERNPLARLTAKLKKGNSELTVEVLETKGAVSNAGNFCRYCVLDALHDLDDRPRVEMNEWEFGEGGVGSDTCKVHNPWGNCGCGRCAKCGQPLHCSLHMHGYGGKVGGTPFDHRFEPCASQRPVPHNPHYTNR